MKTSSLIFICFFLAVFAVGVGADVRSKRKNAAIPIIIHARIIQLEDERNLNGGELTGLLKHRNAAVRERAALAIGRIGDKRGTDALIHAMSWDKNEAVRLTATFALGEIEDVKAVMKLMALLSTYHEDSYLVRARAAEALGKIASVPENVEALGKDKIVWINNALLVHQPSLSGQLTPDDEMMGRLVITALMRLRHPGSIASLTEQLKSGRAEIRAFAANALAGLRQPIDSAVFALIEALNDGDADVRANAARGLGASKDSRAVEPLLNALQDKSEHVQVNAVRALATIGDRRAVEQLVEL